MSDENRPQGRGPVQAVFALASAALGLAVLCVFAWLGGLIHGLGVALPAPVIGLALLATTLSLSELKAASASRVRPLAMLRRAMTPVSRTLIRHLGLLFVPAGVGVMTQWATLRSAWPAILTGLIGSTLVGLAATGWLMQALSQPRRPHGSGKP